MPVTIGQKTVGTSAVQFTATTTNAPPQFGIKLSVSSTTAKVYYGYANTVTTANGFYINGVAEIHPASFSNFSEIWFISDTASQGVSFEVVGQSITIS